MPSVRSVLAKQVGYQTSSADGSCELAGAPSKCGMASLAGPCRSSNRADRRFTQRRCVPGSSAAHPSKRHPLDLASRRLSPYRSRASPRRKLPGIRQTTIRYRAQSQADHDSCTAHSASATNNPKHCKKIAPKNKDLQSLSLPGDPAAIRLSRTRL